MLIAAGRAKAIIYKAQETTKGPHGEIYRAALVVAHSSTVFIRGWANRADKPKWDPALRWYRRDQ